MKKTLLLTIAGILCFVLKSQSQTTEFGLRGGLNLSDLHSSATNSLNTRASVFVGGLAHIHLTRYFAIQPELDYSCQGATQNTDGGDVTWRLNYVNVPVLLQYMFDNGFRLQTGPQMGLLASAKRKAGGTISDISNNFTTGDFSWSLGAGYLSASGLGVDLRYNLGINNINNTGSADKLQNRVFQAGLFYQFKHL
jgi:hypothetical protein